MKTSFDNYALVTKLLFVKFALPYIHYMWLSKQLGLLYLFIKIKSEITFMSQYDADALSRIGRQSNPTNNPTTTNRDEEKKLLHMWVHGLIILFIPLIILPLYLIFTSKTSEFWTCVIIF